MRRTVICRRGHFGRLVVFLVLLGVILFYIGSHREREDNGTLPTTPGISIEPTGLAVFAPLQEQTEYFIDYRLERDSARQQQLDLLREVINNPNSGEEARAEADSRFLRIIDTLGKESEIEGLIRAKGFEDALVLLNDHAATAIIKAQALGTLEVTRIADIITRSTGLAPSAISVICYAQ